MEENKVEELKIDSDKFEFLYDYKAFHLDLLREDYKELENKATKYLTFITIVLTIISILFRSYLIESEASKDFLYYASLVTLMIYVISVFPPLRYLFSCIKINKMGDLPQKGVREYILENSKETVYLGMADRLDEIIDIYKKVNAEKADYLKKAFEEIKVCSLIFLLFIILFLAHKFTNHEECKKTTRTVATETTVCTSS